MHSITSHAFHLDKRVTLSCFLSNTATLEFYRALDFVIVSTEEWFATLERTPA